MVSKGQVLQAWRPSHFLQSLVEMNTKVQNLQAARPFHAYKALVEVKAKGQVSKAVGPRHPLYAPWCCKLTMPPLPKASGPSVGEKNALKHSQGVPGVR